MDWIYCEHCGQIIGAYEPARAIRADRTSLQGPTLELRSELKTPGTVAVHERCYRVLETPRQSD